MTTTTRQSLPEPARPSTPCQHAGQVGAGALRASLPDEHPIARFMDEHQVILGLLARLDELTAGPKTDSPASARVVLEELDRIAVQLIGAEPHHLREERVLFPALRERGVEGPPEVMEHEHVKLRALKHALHDLVRRSLVGGRNLVPELCSTAAVLVAELRAHIAKEDGVLYPMALRVIGSPSAWTELRRRCDAIGYCCPRKGAPACDARP